MPDQRPRPERAVETLDLDAILRLSTASTLESLGQAATFAGRVAARWSSWPDPIAFVGFGGENVRGALALGTPWTFLQESHPAPGSGQDDLLDWSRELANLVLGSIKSALLARGIRTALGLPVSVSGTDVKVAVSGSGGVVQVLSTKHGELIVGLDLEETCQRQSVSAVPTSDMIFF